MSALSSSASGKSSVPSIPSLTVSPTIRGSDTGGSTRASAHARQAAAVVKARSLSRRLAVLAIAFVAVPIAIYITLRDAASERQALILDSVQEQGRIVANALAPSLQQQDASP